MSELTRTEAEYAQLKDERDTFQEALHAARLRLQELAISRDQFIERNRQLRKALEAVEWVSGANGERFCPACQSPASAGHKLECTTTVALGRERAG